MQHGLAPSQTEDGRRWVAQFPSDRRDTATQLIDSLEIHDHATAMSALAGAVIDLAKNNRVKSPVIAIPIRSREDLPPTDVEHEAYTTFHPGDPIPAVSGSEADVGASLRNAIDELPNEILPPDTPLSDIRAMQSGTIALITDYCGSGTQAMRFADMFTRNKYLRSSFSFGKLEMRVVSYATSSAARNMFKPLSRLPLLSLSAAKSASSANWSKGERDAIYALCRDYCDPNQPDRAYGYKESFGLHLSSLRVPNNLPSILIQSTDEVNGLFPKRIYPGSLLKELTSFRENPKAAQILRNLGEIDVANSIDARRWTKRMGEAVAALHLFKIGGTPDSIRERLVLTDETWRMLHASLMGLGFLTIDNDVTDHGERELLRVATRSRKARRENTPPANPVDYIPTQLR